MGHVGTLLSNLGDDHHAWPARCEIGMGIGRTEERTDRVGQKRILWIGIGRRQRKDLEDVCVCDVRV